MNSAAPGISIDENELKAAFEFFDVSGTGKITLADLKNRLGAFYKNVPLREYKFLMNNQSELHRANHDFDSYHHQ